MHVITKKRLREFWEKYPDAEADLRAWYNMFESKNYATPHDVKEDYASVSFLKGNKTVFNICVNKYRLVVTIRYDAGRVFIRDVLTHKQYDKRNDDGTL